jgi:outer membrane protein assembly factor BamB
MVPSKFITSVLSPDDNNFSWNGYDMYQAVVLGNQQDALAINGGRLMSFDLTNRQIRWTMSNGFNDQPSLVNGVIYAVQNGVLSVRREDTGAQLWMWVPPFDALAGCIIVTVSHVFVSGAATTYAIDLDTHASVWTYPAAGPLALSEGTLYIAGSSGTLTAISLGSAASGGADLELSMTGAHTVGSGSPGSYLVAAEIINAGPSNATNLVFSALIPDGFGVESTSANCSFAGQIVTCGFSGLPVEKRYAEHFSVVPAKAGTYSIAAKVRATQVNPGGADNKAVLQLTVQ